MNSISEPSHITLLGGHQAPPVQICSPKTLASAETIQHTARSVNGERNQV